jgi:hypothetical protein
LGSAVAERAQDRVLAGGHGGAELVVTCLQLGKALPTDEQLRLLPRERGFALPSERLGGGTLVPRILDCGAGRCELGRPPDLGRHVHDLLAHRTGFARHQLPAQVIGLVERDRAPELLLGRIQGALCLRRGAPGGRGLPLPPFDLDGVRFHRLAPPSELGRSFRRKPAGSSQLDGAITLALQEIIQLLIVAGSLCGLPCRLDGCRLLRLRRARRCHPVHQRGPFGVQGVERAGVQFKGCLELLALRQAADDLVEAGHLRPQRLDRPGALFRRSLRGSPRLPLPVRRVLASLGLGCRLRRGLRDGEGARRFVEQRQQGRRARRRLDPLLILPHLHRLSAQGGLPGLDLAQLARLRMQALHPGKLGLDLVPPLARGRERRDDTGVLRRQLGHGGCVDSRVLAVQHPAQRIDGGSLLDGQPLRVLAHSFVHVEPQQGAQHAAPVARRRLEETGELALRQHHGLHEGRGPEPEDLHNSIGSGAHLVRQALEFAVLSPLLQTDHLHAVAPQGAGDAVAALADLEVQHHGDPVPWRRDHLGPVLQADARDLAIEREDHRVEESRLARPRGPRDGEQLETPEVDLLPIPEAGEALDGEMDGAQRSMSRMVVPGRPIVEILERVEDCQGRRLPMLAEMVVGVVAHGG